VIRCDTDASISVLFRWHDDDRHTHDKHIRAASYDEDMWKPALMTLGIIPAPIKDEHGRPRYQNAKENSTHVLRHSFATHPHSMHFRVQALPHPAP
jgi:hypothetical protein